MVDEDGKAATHYVSRIAVRNVSSSPVETDVIYRLDTGKMITLSHLGQVFKEMKDEQIKGFLLKLRTSSSSPLLEGITFTQVATSVDKGRFQLQLSNRLPVTRRSRDPSSTRLADTAAYEIATALQQT